MAYCINVNHDCPATNVTALQRWLQDPESSQVIYKSVWKSYLKYLNIKNIYLIVMSPLSKRQLLFKCLCVCAWCDNITASCSV